MKFTRQVLLACSSLALSGCYAMQGTPQVINAGGVVNQSGPVKNKTENLKDNFRLAVDQAVANENWGTVKATLDTGFLLVYSNCDDFFRVTGARQRDSNIARDMLAPLVSILTGVISLKDFQNAGRQQDYIEGLGIGSAAFLSVLDIHDRHFLFGAENIYEVRTLISDGLDANERAVRNMGEMNFEGAVKQLMRHQGICTPAGIKFFVKKAIADSRIVASPYIGTGLSAEALDSSALEELGITLGLAGEASIDQAGALWWLYLGQASQQAEYTAIRKKLMNIPAGNPITGAVGAFSHQSKSPFDDEVKTALRKLSSPLVTSFKASRDKFLDDPKFGMNPGPADPFFQNASSSGYRLEIAK